MRPAPQPLPPLVAVVGCDGSGKSTVSAQVLAWMSEYGATEAAHLGQQGGNIARRIARWPLVGGWLETQLARKADKTRVDLGTRQPGPLTALVITALSLRRLWRFRRMLALRRRGLMIVTDRYPQVDVPVSNDGPGLPATAPGNALARWLARREWALYTWMASYRPDLVLRLNVSLDVACARKPDHPRGLLASKMAALPLLRFNGAKIVEIDADLPLPEVLAAARAAVAQMLAERGYPPGKMAT